MIRDLAALFVSLVVCSWLVSSGFSLLIRTTVRDGSNDLTELILCYVRTVNIVQGGRKSLSVATIE